MLCEKCHQEEALVHITEKDGPGLSEATPTVRWHFCEPCGEEYQREVHRFLEHSSPRYQQGMSKQERAQATQEFRDLMRRHMADWVSGRQSE
jgi:protein-arginine kinase activator protein McsA